MMPLLGNKQKSLHPPPDIPASAANKASDPPDVDINVETEAQGGLLLVIPFSENLNTSPEYLKLRGLKMKVMP